MYMCVYVCMIQWYAGCACVEKYALEFPALGVFHLSHSHHGPPSHTASISQHRRYMYTVLTMITHSHLLWALHVLNYMRD